MQVLGSPTLNVPFLKADWKGNSSIDGPCSSFFSNLLQVYEIWAPHPPLRCGGKTSLDLEGGAPDAHKHNAESVELLWPINYQSVQDVSSDTAEDVKVKLKC